MSIQCSFDMFIIHVLSQIWWQGVPHTRTISRETTVTELLCVRGTTHICSDAEWSWGRPVSAVSWTLEVRYVGVCPANDWCNVIKYQEFHFQSNVIYISYGYTALLSRKSLWLSSKFSFFGSTSIVGIAITQSPVRSIKENASQWFN